MLENATSVIRRALAGTGIELVASASVAAYDERAPGSFQSAVLLRGARGVVVAGSSDRPVAPGPPLAGIQAMVERVTEIGLPFGSAESVDARTALRTYTAGAAHAAGAQSAPARAIMPANDLKSRFIE